MHEKKRWHGKGRGEGGGEGLKERVREGVMGGNAGWELGEGEGMRERAMRWRPGGINTSMGGGKGRNTVKGVKARNGRSEA